MNVIKRDGTHTQFDNTKIRAAISKANTRTNEMTEEDLDRITEIATNKCVRLGDGLTVEQIQEAVEDTLLKSRFNKTAKSYILYRDERTRNREIKSKLMRDIGKKLDATNIVNQNANVDEASFGGRKGEADSELMRWFALNKLISKKSRDNHLNNEIYIHDLDSYAVGMHNCLSIPFDKLLAEGFNTRQTDVRPAGSINTAFQLVAVIFQLQSLQQFGGVAATHLDWTMVPYVRKSFRKHFLDGIKWFQDNDSKCRELGEDLAIDDEAYLWDGWNEKIYAYAFEQTKKELEQAVEGMYHNLNTLQSRSGNQLPFTSINYGTCTLPEGRMVIKALLEGSLKGVGHLHKTPIFPCGIFQYMKGVNDKLGTPNYDLYQLALKSTAKRLYPNYANCDLSTQRFANEEDVRVRQAILDQLSTEDQERLVTILQQTPELKDCLGVVLLNNKLEAVKIEDPRTLFSTMGCRTCQFGDINFDESYQRTLTRILHNEKPNKRDIEHISSNQKDSRGNICPVTIILPTLAMEADRDVEKFMELLDKKIHEAKDMLIERFEWICSQDASSAKFMYQNGTMLGYHPEEGIRSALKHGTLALGQLGMAETLQLLIGTDHTTSEGLELAKRIEQLFKDRCAEFKRKYKLNFGVYFSPAENLCFTAMKKFKEKYGEIPNVSDRDYFTNSIHVPVWKEVDPFEKIDIESQLTGYSNAGCITYVELEGAVISNLEALESIVNYAMDKDIPYFAVNVPNDTCLECGYTGEFNDKCPVCGSEHIQQLRRVTGYLSTDYHHFNPGKQKEVEDRVKHA